MSVPGERTQPDTVHVRGDSRAADQLADVPFLAYALIQAFKLFISLAGKRWPELR